MSRKKKEKRTKRPRAREKEGTDINQKSVLLATMHPLIFLFPVKVQSVIYLTLLHFPFFLLSNMSAILQNSVVDLDSATMCHALSANSQFLKGLTLCRDVRTIREIGGLSARESCF